MLFSKPWKKRVVTVLAAVLAARLFLLLLPYPELSKFIRSPYSLPIMDREGTELFTIPLDDGLKRYRLETANLPKNLKRIIIRSEDRWFYFHFGINPVSVIRTSIINYREKRIVSGASTITMQLARMITPRTKGMKGKSLEMVDAVRIEAKLSKKEILSLYLSHIPFGSNLEGYEAASRSFLGKHVRELNEKELMVLSVIPRSPEYYDPVLHPERIGAAVSRMEKPVFKDSMLDVFNSIDSLKDASRDPISAPHFINFVKRQLTYEDFQKGLPITTTLDLSVQSWAEDVLRFYLEGAEKNRISNASLLLLHKSQIIAYIGSLDFFNRENQGQIDGVQILRQPGSTLKPYLYELSLENGFTLASILPDIPMVFGREEIYRPENYSQTYHGPVRIRTALGSSLNIPAVYLLERIGVDNFLERLKKLHFTSLEGQEDLLGLGLAVGNAEVSLYELVRAFRVFKNEGFLEETQWRYGAGQNNKIPVMDKESASLIRHALSDKSARVLGFGRRTVLNTEYPSYFKTGTSNQFNNIWAFGATQDLTCGVWMGNFNGETVIGRPGSSTPASVVEKILGQYSSREPFPEPAGTETAEICTLSGGIKTKNCSVGKMEYFQGAHLPEPCDYHKDDGTVELPVEYNEWMNLYSYDRYNFSLKNELMEVLSPPEGAVYYLSPEIPPESQGVEFKIYGTGSFYVELEGNTIIKGTLPYQGIHNLNKGNWPLKIYGENGVVTRNITVN